MNDNCPICNRVLDLVHTVRTVLVGYCSQYKQEFYKKPDGTWIDRKTWKETCAEFH
ncbi:MAG: hypothetical protein ABSB18_06395 [Candidatus Omnitrophota bacterium]